MRGLIVGFIKFFFIVPLIVLVSCIGIGIFLFWFWIFVSIINLFI
jgi:hypothetical protein